MAPAESEILANYLLQPAPLTSITTFDQFRALFPRQFQASPQVRTLYRDLQAQRNAVVDDVAANIAAEVKRGIAMRREALRQRREADRDTADAEVEMERALFGDESGVKNVRHTLSSVIPELEGASGALEIEIGKLEREEADLTASIQRTVGSLSDLRYGKMSNSQLKTEVLEGLKALQDACDGKS